jgi:hypothetical protein
LIRRSDESLFFEQKWRTALAKPAGGLVPKRTALKAHDIPSLLPDLVIGKLHSTGINVTLAGSNITDRFQQEITGVDYMEFIAEAQRPMMLELLTEICRRPVGACLHQRSEFGKGYIATIEITILPLAGETGLIEYAAALSRQVSHTSSNEYQIKGEPIAADWAGPLDWIDLGASVPQSLMETPAFVREGIFK